MTLPMTGHFVEMLNYDGQWYVLKDSFRSTAQEAHSLMIETQVDMPEDQHDLLRTVPVLIHRRSPRATDEENRQRWTEHCHRAAGIPLPEATT